MRCSGAVSSWRRVKCVACVVSGSVFIVGTLQEYQKRMKKLDQQYKERLRNAGKLFSFQETFSRIVQVTVCQDEDVSL